ncbi:MAG: redoxin family protein [bacterium]
MKKLIIFTVLFILAAINTAQARELSPYALPEFHSDKAAHWINSPPLSVESLKGKVVLLDFWTFDCWNCYRSFPWLNQLEKRYAGQDFLVIGVHTPEFSHERVRKNVEAKIKEFELHHPVIMDNDYVYWKALKNRYWPAFYLVDKQGKVRFVHVGETHEGDRNARRIEADIKLLLAE